MASISSKRVTKYSHASWSSTRLMSGREILDFLSGCFRKIPRALMLQVVNGHNLQWNQGTIWDCSQE